MPTDTINRVFTIIIHNAAFFIFLESNMTARPPKN
jgi:hypothetical protein